MKKREQIGKCTICGKVKPLFKFSKDKRSYKGIRPECKVCETKRGSHSLKTIRFRLKHNSKWYSNITCDLTAKQIESIPNKCFFCNKKIDEGLSIHRVDHTKDYTISNIVKVHKTCHAKYGGHTTAKNPKKGFGTTTKRQ